MGCTAGCAEPCVDWLDWKRCPHCHPPFHYWQPISDQPAKRLAEWVYVCSCLFWTALHDRLLGQELQYQKPNWSAVCNYYSMVHSVRLLWFTLYGSYPKGHAQLAQGLRDGTGAVANWTIETLRPSKRSICASAFQSLLRKEFQESELAAQVPLIGELFESARKLRNDSNYESLILAHQYLINSDEFPVEAEYVYRNMTRTSDAMSKASCVVLQYITKIIECMFRADLCWIGNGSSYSGTDLKRLMWGYVHEKIVNAKHRHNRRSATLSDWLSDLPGVLREMNEIEPRPDTWDDGLRELIGWVKFVAFGGKRAFMYDFDRKVERMEKALCRTSADRG